jgi:TRAP-type C4-dicarboxylate transport system permease small subunit
VAKGKRAGARQRRGLQPALLLLALFTVIALAAWAYLVYAAISFGGDARDGDHQSWAFLALAAVGAIACLFVALMLASRLIKRLATPAPSPSGAPTPGDTEGSHRHRA